MYLQYAHRCHLKSFEVLYKYRYYDTSQSGGAGGWKRGEWVGGGREGGGGGGRERRGGGRERRGGGRWREG